MKHFQKTPEGKYLPTDAVGVLIVIAVIGGFFAIFGIAILLGIEQDKMEAQQTLNEQSGTYTFTDNAGSTFHLTLKTDETCTLQQKGSDHVYYGSWMDAFTEGELSISFDIDDTPAIEWPDGEVYGGDLTIKEGYMYSSLGTANAKNPRKRLPCSK